MRLFAKKITMMFGAGCLGGFLSSIALWLSGFYGITQSLGVQMSPVLSKGWICYSTIRGGLWAFLFLLPLARSSVVKRGLLISLGPTLVTLFVIFPYCTAEGVMGMGLGALTPLFVALFYALWGMIAALWLRITRD